MIHCAIRTVVAFLLFSALPLALLSQEVVLSEYYNIQDVTLEWTEIVVVKDDLNAVGWMITDANTGQVVRQGGPRFNDIPLWRHLRAGTIIVLWHRSLPLTVTLDTSVADGYLEMSARDVRFFSTNYFASPSDLSDMNIADGGDVIEILRADSSHVHALGHMKPAGPAYVAIGSPKVNFDSGNVGAGRSNRVTGRTLAAYAADITKDSAVGGFNDSRGLPNRFDLARTNAGVININHWFWRDTRQPQWSVSPIITVVSRTAQKHLIEWTPIVDTYPQDSTTGYVILRDTLNFASFPANGIRDGQMITKGARIGTALVLDVRPSALGNRFSDSVNLLCGGSYTYRVYGYRYKQDDLLATTDDTTARGRQYTETRFAQSALITKPNPATPLIQASRLEFCFGDTVTLTTSVVADRYDWTLNGGPLAVGGTTRVVVREPGTYRLLITADGGCTALSDAITITTLSAIDVDISPRGLQTICSTDSVVFSTKTTAPTYEWLRDGNLIPGATNRTYTARIPGDYQVRIASSQGCPGISSIIKVRTPVVRFRFSPTSLDFGVLGQCKADTTMSIELLNEGAVPITLTSSNFPPGFALVFPAPGFIVAVGERQALRILYTPATAGVTSGTATFTALPCNQTSTFTVRGERTQISAALDRAQVNYGIFSACPTSDIRTDSTFRVTNAGTSAITVRVPRVDPPFYLLTSFPSNGLIVLPGEALPVKIQYRPLGADLNRGVIQQIAFPFTSTSCNDTLRAQLQAASYAPRFTIEPTTIDVGIVLSCARTLDTVVSVTNTSAVPLTITNIIGSGISMIGAVVVVAPQSSKPVAVQITPASVGGTFTLSGQVQGQPCGLSSLFTVEGQVIAPTYQLEKSIVNFGQSVLCGNVQRMTVPVYVVAKGLSGLRSRVEDFTISAPFTTDLVLRTTLTDTLRFNVSFNPATVGLYNGFLNISLGPCLDAVTLNLSAEVLSAGRKTFITGNDFGTLAPTQTSSQTVLIYNTGGSTIDVAALEGVTLPFRIVSSTPLLPTQLAPLDSVIVIVAYDFADYNRRDTINIVSRSTGACADTTQFQAYASTVSQGTITGIVVTAPANVVGIAGTDVAIPLSLESLQPLDSANITQVTIDVSYNPTLLKAFVILQGAGGAKGTISESQPGRARILITSNTPIVASQPLVVVQARTYVSNVSSTPFAIDSVKIPGASATGRNGSVTVVEKCIISAELNALGQAVALHVERVGSSGVEVEVTTLTDETTTLSVYDLNGQCVLTPIAATLPVGAYQVTFDVSTLSSGAYIIVLRNGHQVQSEVVYLYR